VSGCLVRIGVEPSHMGTACSIRHDPISFPCTQYQALCTITRLWEFGGCIAAVSAWSLFRTGRARRHHAALVCLALHALQIQSNRTGTLFHAF
jgi:hypothetical protein